MAQTPEKKIKGKIVEILKEYGAYYFYPVTGGFGGSGIPDICCCYKGSFLGIEVKADFKKNKPTALQMKNLNDIDKTGGTALVLDCDNYDYLRQVLDHMDKKDCHVDGWSNHHQFNK